MLLLKHCDGLQDVDKISEEMYQCGRLCLKGIKKVIKLLFDHGANLSNSIVGFYSCTIAEQNNVELLKEIVRHRGNVTWAKCNGCTTLHVVVWEDNIKIVKFLLDDRANIDVRYIFGRAPKNFVEQQDMRKSRNLSC